MREEIDVNFIDATEISESVKNNKQNYLKEIFSDKEENNKLKQHKKETKKWKKILASFFVVFFVVFAVFSSTIAFSNENLIKGLSKLNFLYQFGNLINSSDQPLKGELEDRINFLLIGIGGKNHEGGTLADTIILITFKPSTKQFAMISIPRDLYVKPQGQGWMKINAISAYAEKKKPGSGPEALRSFLSQLLGTEIHYYAEIDFEGFEKLIDELGGIDILVENDLIDYSYPVKGRENAYPYESRFEKLVIKKGEQHFDGATALKYARSRHALGREGSDFARSKRQQKILLALKDKILTPGTFFNINKINALLDMYQEHISTNLEIWEMIKLLKIAKEVDFSKPISFSLIDNGMLYDQMIEGVYVLLPYGGNFEKIKFVWQNIFTITTSTITIDKTKWSEFKDVATSTKTTSTNEIINTPTSTEINFEETNIEPFNNENETSTTYKATIEIQNGTLITGWASQEKIKLTAKGFNVVKIGNATLRDYKNIKIYDFSGGKYNKELSDLSAIYGVSPSQAPAEIKSTSDILIILGK